MHWILTEPKTIQERELHAILERSGTPHTLVASGRERGSIVPDVDVEGPVLCFGSPGLRLVARTKGWSPGAFDIDWLDHRRCVEVWGDAMLNADARFGTLADVGSLVASSGHRDVFVRPARDDKSIDAVRVAADDVGSWLAGQLDRGVPPDTGVILAEAKKVHAEWRTWVVEGRLVTTSLYRRGGRALFDGSDAPSEMVRFASDRAAELEACGSEAPQAYVLDVCLADSGMRIVEVNGICGARLYGCDVGRLFAALDGLAPPDVSPGTVPG